MGGGGYGGDDPLCGGCGWSWCRCGQRIYPKVDPTAIYPEVWLDMEDGWDVHFVRANFNRDVELIEVVWEECPVCTGTGVSYDGEGGAITTCQHCRGGGAVCC